MTDIQNLYADADKPNWTGGVYSPETLDEIDALYIRLTDISRGIIDGHI